MSEPALPLRPGQVMGRLLQLARDTGRPAAGVYTLYALERVLARLGQTRYRDDFILKGGILLAAYKLRRPTRDIDMQAIDFQLDAEHMRAVIVAIAAVDAEDGLAFDTGSVTVQQIRDDGEYTGLRVIVRAALNTYRFLLKLDVSTGDPIWPEPQTVRLPGLLGGHVDVIGHPLATVIAEKTVTVLPRGTQSTRWRDFVDVRALARRYPFVAGELAAAGAAVSVHRGQELGALAAVTEGYGALAQGKWAAWVASNGLQDAVEADLDAQVAAVVAFIDPVYLGTVSEDATWDPVAFSWSEPARV